MMQCWLEHNYQLAYDSSMRPTPENTDLQISGMRYIPDSSNTGCPTLFLINFFFY